MPWPRDSMMWNRCPFEGCWQVWYIVTKRAFLKYILFLFVLSLQINGALPVINVVAFLHSERCNASVRCSSRGSKRGCRASSEVWRQYWKPWEGKEKRNLRHWGYLSKCVLLTHIFSADESWCPTETRKTWELDWIEKTRGCRVFGARWRPFEASNWIFYKYIFSTF